MARRLGETVIHAGLREYYNPFTGAGMAATHFSWSTLVLELTDPDPGASSSYLAADPSPA